MAYSRLRTRPVDRLTPISLHASADLHNLAIALPTLSWSVTRCTKSVWATASLTGVEPLCCASRLARHLKPIRGPHLARSVSGQRYGAIGALDAPRRIPERAPISDRLMANVRTLDLNGEFYETIEQRCLSVEAAFDQLGCRSRFGS
jgi:hypothetical protein